MTDRSLNLIFVGKCFNFAKIKIWINYRENPKKENDYEIKEEAEYIVAGVTVQKKRKSEKRL